MYTRWKYWRNYVMGGQACVLLLTALLNSVSTPWSVYYGRYDIQTDIIVRTPISFKNSSSDELVQNCVQTQAEQFLDKHLSLIERGTALALLNMYNNNNNKINRCDSFPCLGLVALFFLRGQLSFSNSAAVILLPLQLPFMVLRHEQFMTLRAWVFLQNSRILVFSFTLSRCHYKLKNFSSGSWEICSLRKAFTLGRVKRYFTKLMNSTADKKHSDRS